MKICIVSPYAYPLFNKSTGEAAGGAETQLYTLANALKARGHEVHFIVDAPGLTQNGQSIGGILLHRSLLRYMGGSNRYLLPDWISFMRLLWRIDANIHLIKVPRNLLLPLALFARLRSRKAIYIVQSDIDASREGVLANNGQFAYWFYRWGLFLADAVVAQTEFQQELFAKSFSKHPTVIRNVVTLDKESAVAREDYILWVGNSSYQKQPELFAELARRLPDRRFKMIMSLGERASDEFIKMEASKLANLEYIGFVPFHEIGSYYRKAKLLVCTSVREGFPNTFLQAWQSGTPVVSLHVDPDGVIDTFGLGCVSSGSMDKLVADIGRLMKDENQLAEMGRNSLAYIDSFHSLVKSVDDYETLFATLTTS